MAQDVVTVMAPPALVGHDVADALRAALVDVDVRVVSYIETLEQRQARREGRIEEYVGELPELSEDLTAALAESVAILALDVPSNLPALAPNLRLVQAVGAGIERFESALFAEHGVTLCNASGVAARPIAEFVLARVLEVYKDLRTIESQQRERVWKRRFARELGGTTMGVIGMGGIGQAVAGLASAFDMRVLGARRSGAPAPHVDEMIPLAALDDLLARSDVVVLAAPQTAETRDLFDSERFDAMKEGAIFCNVSRGTLVVEPAVIGALESGHLAAAILDVTRNEPLPSDDPLWDAPNLYLSPHCSSSLDHYGRRLVELFADNVERVRRGEPLRNAVDPTAGY